MLHTTTLTRIVNRDIDGNVPRFRQMDCPGHIGLEFIVAVDRAYTCARAVTTGFLAIRAATPKTARHTRKLPPAHSAARFCNFEWWKKWSEWRDLNPRPLVSQTSTLTRLRHTPTRNALIGIPLCAGNLLSGGCGISFCAGKSCSGKPCADKSAFVPADQFSCIRRWARCHEARPAGARVRLSLPPEIMR